MFSRGKKMFFWLVGHSFPLAVSQSNPAQNYGNANKMTFADEGHENLQNAENRGTRLILLIKRRYISDPNPGPSIFCGQRRIVNNL